MIHIRINTPAGAVFGASVDDPDSIGGVPVRIRRVFLIVLDSFGIGALPDAARYGDEDSNTLAAVMAAGARLPNLARLGLFHIEGAAAAPPQSPPLGAFARLAEQSMGKDTTTGHWEIGGLISARPMPTYPQGFPPEIIEPFKALSGRGVLCNKPYPGTDVIRDYGRRHLESGDLIVYTSADSVFQIAAHEKLVPPEELYRYCRQARGLLTGAHGVGRVIARPFAGEYPDFYRTANRHDFSLPPPRDTLLDYLSGAGLSVIGVGKIGDIFADRGLTRSVRTKSNEDGMDRLMEILETDFQGLCFVNLVDFDMLYGHRNDAVGYAAALERFDERLADVLRAMKEEDLVMITADHGCDPSTPSTDHSREYVPLLAYGSMVRPGADMGTRPTFADIAATLLALFGVRGETAGSSLAPRMLLPSAGKGEESDND
jgi:phosphopentomutase